MGPGQSREAGPAIPSLILVSHPYAPVAKSKADKATTPHGDRSPRAALRSEMNQNEIKRSVFFLPSHQLPFFCLSKATCERPPFWAVQV